MKNKSAFGIDDKGLKSVQVFSEEFGSDKSKMALDAALSLVPFIGSPILSLMNDLAGQRLHKRIVEMFSTMKELIEEVDEGKINVDYFKSEEFQTLLFLGFEQLRTTHDKEKQSLLAHALTNSGVNEFSSEERKELFVRTLRDLSPSHIRVLKELMPPERLRNLRPDVWPTRDGPTGEELAILQQLTAHGLVEESLTVDEHRSLRGPRYGTNWSENEIIRAIKEYVNVPPERRFRLNSFGMDFLRFVGGS
jgi:hypothetical protein